MSRSARAKKILLLLPLLAGLTAAQDAAPAGEPPKTPAEIEQSELSHAVADSANSPIDFIRALERHLTKYPETLQRAIIEKALAKAALEANDRARIVLYGSKVLLADPNSSDLVLLDRVTRTLLDTDEKEPSRQALAFAKRYETQVEAMRLHPKEGHMTEALWGEEADKGRSRALVLEARATGNLGSVADALRLALQAWETSPTAEAAREVARWLTKAGRETEAVEFYANAFTIEDGRGSEADRARDRVHLRELYTKLNRSETGLGDVILRAYDRMTALKQDRMARLRVKDPNAGMAELLDFTIPKTDGTGSLTLASLKGKAVVMDFWATWCGPCRVQHPMIENVKKRFADAGDVVFLSIDADDDHSLVAPFLKEMKWDSAAYFEAGLGSLLKISSIPTIVVLGRDGSISSRMTGFIPERFEDMLTQRITEARGVPRTN